MPRAELALPINLQTQTHVSASIHSHQSLVSKSTRVEQSAWWMVAKDSAYIEGERCRGEYDVRSDERGEAAIMSFIYGIADYSSTITEFGYLCIYKDMIIRRRTQDRYHRLWSPSDLAAQHDQDPARSQTPCFPSSDPR